MSYRVSKKGNLRLELKTSTPTDFIAPFCPRIGSVCNAGQMLSLPTKVIFNFRRYKFGPRYITGKSKQRTATKEQNVVRRFWAY